MTLLSSGMSCATAAQDRTGHAEGIAVASSRQPRVDELTVRQTGAVATR